MKKTPPFCLKNFIIFFLTMIFLFTSTQIFAQSSTILDESTENSPQQNFTEEENSTTQKQESQNQFKLSKWDYFFTLGPGIYINTESTKKSAPSPIFFSGGVGFDFFNDKIINFQSKITFFTNYYLWTGQNARPAEIENRTAFALSFLVDFDASKTVYFTKSALQFGAGISVLARYAFLANGVDKEDSGGTSSQNAGEDVKSINKWFFSNMNFLYPNITISYLRLLESKWHAGLESRFYIPLGSMKDGRGLDTMIISLSAKLCSK